MICHHCNREIEYAAVCPYCGTRMLKEPLPHHLPVGTMIDNRYEVLGVLGEGGFGITYLGINRNLDLTVAVKEFYPQGVTYRDTKDGRSVYSSSDNSAKLFSHGKESFLGEAKTLVKFNSEPGIVSVLDIINENNTAYLIMEYLDGETLQQHLRQHGKMKVSDAFKLLKPMMKTLKKVHDAGIIHRDISPDNIMMLRDGSLKLMDFGAARMFEDDHRSMSVMLKKGYAPEEQYRRNGEQGPWTDVYALCATIYRCITGKSPIDSLERLAGEELTPPSKLGADISPALEKVLMHGLAVHKRDRIQGMAELLSAAEEAMNSTPSNNSSAEQEKEQNDDTVLTVWADDFEDQYQTIIADQPSVPVRPVIAQNNPIAAEKPKKSKKKVWFAVGAVLLIAVVTFVTLFIINFDTANYEYKVGNDDTAEITGYNGTRTKITIPSKIDGHTVTTVAVPKCKNLISVSIPDTVISIKDDAFYGCSSLEAITIPDSVTTIGNNAFDGCSSLTEVIIPDSVMSIGTWAFFGCSNLSSVTIPDSITTIGECSFGDCHKLKSVTISDSVTSIGENAFQDCSVLTEVTIPDSVKTIGDNAFVACNNLTIHGKKGSAAEDYAKKNNIPFKGI